MADFTDEDLINYCDAHCETPRGLFAGQHIKRMYELAGHPVPPTISSGGFYPMHGDMKQLCRDARARMRRQTFKLVVNNG